MEAHWLKFCKLYWIEIRRSSADLSCIIKARLTRALSQLHWFNYNDINCEQLNIYILLNAHKKADVLIEIKWIFLPFFLPAAGDFPFASIIHFLFRINLSPSAFFRLMQNSLGKLKSLSARRMKQDTRWIFSELKLCTFLLNSLLLFAAKRSCVLFSVRLIVHIGI